MSDKRELIVQWSKHAIERVAERFGFAEREIPNKQITAAASQSKSGSIFRVYCAGIVYVVKRQKKSVLILTCFEDEHAGISRTKLKIRSKKEAHRDYQSRQRKLKGRSSN